MKKKLRLDGTVGRAGLSGSLFFLFWMPICTWAFYNGVGRRDSLAWFTTDIAQALKNTVLMSSISAASATILSYALCVGTLLYRPTVFKSIPMVAAMALLVGYLSRCYSWQTVLLLCESATGVQVMHTWWGTIFVLFASLLPVAAMFIYNACNVRLDMAIRAGMSLGASSPEIARKIIVPLTWRGVVSSWLLLSASATSFFVTVRITSGGQYDFLSKLILDYYWEFGDARRAVVPTLASIALTVAFVSVSSFIARGDR